MKYFEKAASALGEKYRAMLMSADDGLKSRASEITLRFGRCVAISTPDGVWFGSKSGRWQQAPFEEMYIPGANDAEDCLLQLCGYSIHSCQQQLKDGYITVAGGHRAGLCGSAVYDAMGARIGIKNITAVRLRIARPLFGVGEQFYELLINKKSGLPSSILVAGSPGCGKTTLLRDFARYLGNGGSGRYFAATVVDERSELAAQCGESDGILGGLCCDVLDGISKADGIMQAVRVLRPNVVICDEIGTVEEARALCASVNSGVAVLASIHAGSESELRTKPQMRLLSECAVFSKCILLKGYTPAGYKFELIPGGEL